MWTAIFAAMLVWCSSLGWVRVKNKRVFMPHEARTPDLVSLVGGHADELSPNMIFGLISLGEPKPRDFMDVLTDDEDHQVSFWKAISPNSVVYIWRILDAYELREPVPLLQCRDRCLRGCVVLLEAGQATRLWEQVPARFSMKWGARCPEISVRTPPQHAILSVKGLWSSICLPDVPSSSAPRKQGGSYTSHINWQLLGVAKPLESSQEVEELHPEPSLDKHSAREIANVLRSYAKNLDPNDDFHQAEYIRLQHLVRTMQDVQEQLDPVYVQKACRDLAGRASIHTLDDSSRKKLKYNVAWLLQVFLLADCLRDTAQLDRVLELSMRMLLPPVLVKAFKENFVSAAVAMPHKGTISRWRLLLDGGFMLWHRRRNNSGNFIRWMMADSSTQHGRTFQLMSTLSLAVQSAAKALRVSQELVLLWCLVLA